MEGRRARHTRRRMLLLETLEVRALLSTFSYSIPRGNGPNDVTLGYNGATTSYEITNSLSGERLASRKAGTSLTDIKITGREDQDTLRIAATFLQKALPVIFDGSKGVSDTIAAAADANMTLTTSGLTISPSLLPPTNVTLVGIEGAALTGGGANTLTVNGTSGADLIAVTGSSVTIGGKTVAYTGFGNLQVNALAGNDSVTQTSINAATATTIDGGPDNDSYTGTFAAGFAGALTLQGMESAALAVTGNFDGTLAVQAPGKINSLSVTGTVTAGSLITATNAFNVSIGTLAGTMSVTDTIDGFSVGIVSGSGTLTAGTLSNGTVGTVAAGGTVESTSSATIEDVDFTLVEGDVTMQNGTGITIGTVADTGDVSSSGSFCQFDIGQVDGTVSADHLCEGTVGTVGPDGTVESSGSATIEDVDFTLVEGDVTMQNGTGITIGTVADTGDVSSSGSFCQFDIGQVDGTVSADHLCEGTVGTVGADGTVESDGLATIEGVFFGTVETGGKILANNITDITILNLAGHVVATGIVDGMTLYAVSPTALVAASQITNAALNATNGDDTLVLTSTTLQLNGATILSATSGFDSLRLNALAGNDTIDGSASSSSGTFTFDGGPGNDVMWGGSGTTIFIETPGSSDVIRDAGGIDTIDFSGATLGVTFDLSLTGGQVQVVDSAGNTVAVFGTLENVIGTDSADTLTGNSADNFLVGLGGDDHLVGGSGRDLLIGGAGADRLVGGSGIDLLIAGTTSYDHQDAALRAILAEWSGGTDLATQVLHLRDGSVKLADGTPVFLAKSATVIDGTTYAPTVSDDGVVDRLTGSNGPDWLFFELGLDVVTDLDPSVDILN